MKDYRLTESEEKFAELIWRNEPIGSGELVKLCEKEMNWKKSTTYTHLSGATPGELARTDSKAGLIFANGTGRNRRFAIKTALQRQILVCHWGQSFFVLFQDNYSMLGGYFRPFFSSSSSVKNRNLVSCFP
jgi:hypothetical protein